MITPGSSVRSVGLTPQSNAAPSDFNTGEIPLVLDNPPMPVNLADGWMRERVVPATGCDTSCGGKGFVPSNQATMP